MRTLPSIWKLCRFPTVGKTRCTVICWHQTWYHVKPDMSWVSPNLFWEQGRELWQDAALHSEKVWLFSSFLQCKAKQWPCKMARLLWSWAAFPVILLTVHQYPYRFCKECLSNCTPGFWAAAVWSSVVLLGWFCLLLCISCSDTGIFCLWVAVFQMLAHVSNSWKSFHY